jgi:hypothetical protein
MACFDPWTRVAATVGLCAVLGHATAASNDCKAVVTFKKAQLVTAGQWDITFQVSVPACEYSTGSFSYFYRTSLSGTEVERPVESWTAASPKKFELVDKLAAPGTVQAVRVKPGSVDSSKPARAP